MLRLDPLMDDQELDSRESTGAVYWEGAVRVSHGDLELSNDSVNHRVWLRGTRRVARASILIDAVETDAHSPERGY
jgi:hypothetical protein